MPPGKRKGVGGRGVTHVEGLLPSPKGRRKRVRFLVDSGAMYSLVPHEVWKALQLEPKRRETFRLADGTPVERAVSECHIKLPEGEGTTPVILGVINIQNVRVINI